MEIEKFKLLPEALTRIRQQVISPTFSKLEAAKDHYIMLHVHDVPEPTAHARSKFKDYGIANGNGSAADDIKHAKLFEQMKRTNDRSGFEE